MKKTTLRQAAMKLAIVAIALFAPLGLRAQTTVTIGEGTSSQNFPLPGYWGFQYDVFLYTPSAAAALDADCDISSLAFNVKTNSTSTGAEIYIWVKDVDANYALAATTTFDDYIDGATQVYENDDFSSTTGWNTFTFSSTFSHEGGKALLVAVRAVGCTTSGGCSRQCYYTSASNTYWNKRQDNTDPGTNVSGSLGSNRANIQLSLTYTGTVCLSPSGLAASNITHNSATLSWNENGEETSWVLQYGTDSEFGTYTEENVSTTPSFDLTNLTALTSYYARVKPQCDIDGSHWSNTVTIATTAVATAVGDGWSDDFEGASFGWELINGTLTNQWAWGTAANNGGTHGLYISNDGGTSNAYSHSAAIVYATKLLNFTEGKYEFSYDWKANGESTYDYMRVALVPASVTLTAGTTPSSFGSSTLPSGWIAMDGGSKLNQVTAWQSKSVTLNVAAGNYYLVMAWKNDGGGGTQPPAAVDNVSITRVACPYDVTNLTPSNITTDGATLTWTAGDATQWQVAYSTASNFEGATEEIVSAAIYTMTGLTSSTIYYVKVRAYCGGTDFGSWSEVINFPTECEALDLSTTDFSEDFDDYSAVSAYTPTERVLPICWKAINTCTNSSYKYYPVVSSYSSSSYAYSGSNYLKFYSYYYYDPQDQYAILPEMDGLAGKQVTLMACGYNTSSTFKIGTMSDPTDASTFEMIAEQTLTTTYPTEPFEYIIPTTCTDGYLAIMMEAANSSNSTKGVYIDDIAITDAPTCIKPTNLEVTASGLSVTFTWTSEVGSYEIAHTTDATANPDENVAGTATELTFTMNNIALGDHYFWVRANCGSDGYSEWAGPVSVHIGYCVPTPSNVDGNGISNVTFGMGDNIVNNNTPKATYADYNSEIGAVQAGVESTIAITYATGYTYGTIIWVDFDNSLSFEDNEIVYMGTSTEDNPTTLNATITIPATQATGDYRMRVGGSDSGFDNFINGSSTSAPSACYTGNWACFQDYTLRVLEAPSCLPASDVTVGNVTATSAVISWTNNNDDETNYTVKQGENVLTTTAVDSYIINGLTAATTYPAGTYTIISNCDETAVANVPAFTTECDVVVVDADHPFFEGFEGTTFAPTCWENVNSGSYAWTGSTYQHHNGSACAYSGYNGDIYLKMPEIQISNTLTAPQLTFWSYNTYSSDYDKNSVVLIDGTNETELWSPNSVSQSWEKSTIDLTPYIGQTIRLAFKYEGSNAHGWYIDDVKIEEYHVDKDIEANKWYAISSPVHNSGDNETLAGVTNLTTAADEFDYDLYGYTESAGTWNAPTILEQGKGYIYRRSSNTTLNFVGTPNNSVPAYTLSYACGDNDLKGFNLVGNPYPDEANPDMDCYKLTPAGTWKVKASDENVDVCEAVLVYTDGSNATVSFSAPTPSKSSSDHTALAFTVSNGEYSDVAYARFDNGEGLPKIGHLAANAPMLSIPVEGRRYAIANLGSDCESFDMVFRGTGTYTLSFSGNSSYCHLIDRVAGKDIDMLRQNYTFSSNGFDADRFTVKLSPDAQENAGSNFAYWNGNVWMVEGNGTLQVFDALGRQLLSQEISNSNFEIQNSLFPAAGVYVLRMGEKTQKIVVR